jgi:hypothetical protein
MNAPKNWRALELESGRSPATGRPLRKWASGEVEFDPPTPEDWAALAHYTKLNRRGVDHETAYLAAYGESDPQTIRMLESFLRRGILVGDFAKHY